MSIVRERILFTIGPHSDEAVERTMGRLSDEARSKILGGNAARFFNITVPADRA